MVIITTKMCLIRRLNKLITLILKYTDRFPLYTTLCDMQDIYHKIIYNLVSFQCPINVYLLSLIIKECLYHSPNKVKRRGSDAYFDLI
jgi:hypothetical protein